MNPTAPMEEDLYLMEVEWAADFYNRDQIHLWEENTILKVQIVGDIVTLGNIKNQ